MKTKHSDVLRCLALGAVVMVLFATCTYWLRQTCLDAHRDLTARDSGGRTITISPLPVVPKEIESDPCVLVHSRLIFRVSRTAAGRSMWDDLVLRNTGDFGKINPDVFGWSHGGPETSNACFVYFDRKLGLIVFSLVGPVIDPNVAPGVKTWWYAGPEGVAPTPQKTLGRFTPPLVAGGDYYYESASRRFFRVDLRGRRVVKGPSLDAGMRYHPIQIHDIEKSRDCIDAGILQPPMRRAHEGEKAQYRETVAGEAMELVPTATLISWGGLKAGRLVLDASGALDWLDPNTLTLAGRAGRLPTVAGRFGWEERSPVKGLFAYSVVPIWRLDGAPNERNPSPRYLGVAVATANRDVSRLDALMFDAQGNAIYGDVAQLVNYWDVPLGPTYTIASYLLENLHPPILLLLSEVTAPYIEAVAGARGMFLLPNSTAAQMARMPSELYVTTILAGVGIIAPALVLTALLAWLVGRHARLFGLSKNARTLWVLGTALFGIPAYITYHLTRPATALVTCRNCGRPRRPDHERCHRCDSPWEVPELNPPAWRVCDGAASGVCKGNVKSPVEAEQKMDSSVNMM